MNIEIHTEQAALSDLDEIMHIEQTSFGADAFSRQQMAYLVNRAKGVFLIARFNKQIAGYISFTTSNRHNTGRIYSIAVNPEYRSCGIGGILLSKITEYANLKKIRAIFLEVRTDNSAAISIYEKKGFAKRFIKTNYYHDGSAAYSMVLCL